MSEQGDIDFQKQVISSAYQPRDISLPQKMPLTENLHFVFLVGGCLSVVQHWLKNGLKESPGEIAQVVYDMAAEVR